MAMRIGLSLLGSGTHKAGWRHPEAPRGGGMDVDLWQRMAVAAEAAKIDFIFLADDLAVPTSGSADDLSFNSRIDRLEPLTLLSALSVVTQQIGLIATASTTYNEPFTIARMFGSLDHLSHGRAGWNVVTSVQDAEAANFSREKHLDHGARYRRAEEFVEVVTGLWDTWDDDAFIRDKSSGRYFDPAKMRQLDHRGEYFAVRGPLNMPRPPQGHPVITQAGASEAGQALAARTADVVYTVTDDLDEAATFYAGLKERVRAVGRSPDHVLVMPGMLPIVGATEREAHDKLRQLQALIDPRMGISLLTVAFGDLSGYDVDGPLPDLSLDDSVSTGFRDHWRLRAEREGLTIRQIYEQFAINRGHCLMVGTPQSIADQMQRWFQRGACDGFNVLATHLPGGLTPFLELVIPELQARGLFHREYEGYTLRENLGLPRPRTTVACPRGSRKL